jgi:hypothetical protein
MLVANETERHLADRSRRLYDALLKFLKLNS